LTINGITTFCSSRPWLKQNPRLKLHFYRELATTKVLSSGALENLFILSHNCYNTYSFKMHSQSAVKGKVVPMPKHTQFLVSTGTETELLTFLTLTCSFTLQIIYSRRKEPHITYSSCPMQPRQTRGGGEFVNFIVVPCIHVLVPNQGHRQLKLFYRSLSK
jgi:hypothetical protein